MKSALLAMTLVGLSLTISDVAVAQQPKPNIVFVLVDNAGWGDFSAYGGTVPTPRIDSIAKDGLRFNNYTVEAQCTPSRSAIMTGRLPVRSGTMRVPYPGEGDFGLAPWEYTLGELFSDAGYATAAFGKWHLGEVQGRLPTDQGFDEWFGIKNSSDEAGYSSYKLFRDIGYPEPQWWESKKGAPPQPAGVFDKPAKDRGDEKITEHAVAFIDKEAKAKEPFFMYVAFLQIHPPMGVHPDFAGKSGGGLYADCLAEMDHRVGQILDAIEAAGIADNTIVEFSSDNATSPLKGASDGGSNGPWRGDFFNPPFEGSYRVAAMVRWPGHIAAGRQSQELMTAEDWLPTLAGLAGESARVPTDRPIDGINAADFVLGKQETSGRDSVLFFGLDGRLMSVKWKNFKVVFRKSDGIDEPITDVQVPMVFNLIGDPGEHFNLWEVSLDMGWVYRPVFEQIEKFERSVTKFPNIKTGEEFKGYSSR
ncbi:arylsulfatase [Rhizobium calliandrae]|uniref:Arylsulfatase n=1 Tax=Rhizobium calliandrae TaxID=1312182 RepID=A0ABT7K7P0_9HYPH|nr:arylsulfatase [Rhizobium calliandrae]MDL2404623.1 arylsulfatase [Rhizobium calliandrae]